MRRILQLLIFLPTLTFAQYTGMRFDGGGDYIVTGFNGISGSGSRTVQCWFQGFSSSVPRFFVDMGTAGNGARFSVKINGSSNVVRVGTGGSGLDGTINIANNFWHQITVVYDDSALTNKYKIYVDGILDVQGDIPVTLNTPATSASPMTIGIRTDLDSGTDLFGALDDIRIWSIPLSAAEIAANYNQELCGTPVGLAAYYKMNEGIAVSNNTGITSLIDEVTPSSVNTLNGFMLTGNTSNYVTHILALVNNSVTQTLVSCGSYTWPQNGQTYSNAGMYYDTVTDPTGCDSVYILDLSISLIVGPTVSVVTCTDYFWPVSGQTYASSGMYNDTLTTSAGCDSLVTLDLTITPITPMTIQASGCTDYLWSQTGITYSTSGMYTDTVITAAGCDSIVTLDLTINTSSSSTVTVTSCSDYVWSQNSMTYNVSGSYFDTIPNTSGCDSVVELVLTIAPLPITTQTINDCSSYLWNNQTYTTSGIYTDTIITAAGCDSIVELTLNLFSDSNTVTYDGTGTFMANYTGSVTYQWIDCLNNTLVLGATSQSFTPTFTGTYAVVTSTSTCTDTSECIEMSTFGIEELNDASFKLYPNPTASIFTIESSSDVLIQSISIYDIQGKEIESILVGFDSVEFDLSNYDSGVYHIRVVSESGQRLNYRLVKK